MFSFHMFPPLDLKVQLLGIGETPRKVTRPLGDIGKGPLAVPSAPLNAKHYKTIII